MTQSVVTPDNEASVPCNSGPCRNICNSSTSLKPRSSGVLGQCMAWRLINNVMMCVTLDTLQLKVDELVKTLGEQRHLLAELKAVWATLRHPRKTAQAE